MTQDRWAALGDAFVEAADAPAKGRVRSFVSHRQLLRHLPDPPATVLDVGGGAAHLSLSLARLRYEVTVVDPSVAMLAKAEHRLRAEPEEVRRRVQLMEEDGEAADTATGGQRFAVVLCHGVLMYLKRPEPIVHTVWLRCTRRRHVSRGA